MNDLIFYHYISKEKLNMVKKDGVLKPSAPFNSKITNNEEWKIYTKKFAFPISYLHICCFLELEPLKWKEYGLFGLLMEEYAGGDFVLEIRTRDNFKNPILIRDHYFHSPKEYGYSPEIWRKSEIRDSRPDLRNKWYESAIPIQQYINNYICPEVLIPFNIPINKISFFKILKEEIF